MEIKQFEVDQNTSKDSNATASDSGAVDGGEYSDETETKEFEKNSEVAGGSVDGSTSYDKMEIKQLD